MDKYGKIGLANQALLDKIDKLCEFNVKSIGLPQLVVVGDQSSGKSSFLHSLTGYGFPQDAGLCTRYAAQISCRRGPIERVVISVVPGGGTDKAIATRLSKYREEVPAPLTNDDLLTIFQAVHGIMEIRMNANDKTPGRQAFSENILKIEIEGSTQEHFTVIGVPGIFRVPDTPLTTDHDVSLIRDMVMRYMQDSRTIILAVLPSNVDIST
jgi:GTPase SAR1 family protein